MRKPVALTLLALSQVAVLALWFAASAVAPALAAQYALSGGQLALLTSAVQAGFVAGSLTSAWTGLPDRFDPRRIYFIAALLGAGANAAFLLVEPGTAASVALRFVTGAAMAGVYPIGMKIAMSWAKDDAGLLVGLLVGALTLGSASPHLFYFFGGVDWHFVIAASSVSAAAGGTIVLFLATGPALRLSGRFNPSIMLQAWRNRGIRYANLGYFGHMWELYAMWAWVGAFLTASFATVELGAGAAKLAAFATVAIGALGAVAGGAIADRIGRTTLTIAAMAVSGLCCLLAGTAFGAPAPVVIILCLVWGIAVIADSAQFSASVAELAAPGTQGTMLTMQTAIGFALTLITIQLIPIFVDLLTWRYAFAPLAIGPFLGVLAMWRLRTLPEAQALAGGRR